MRSGNPLAGNRDRALIAAEEAAEHVEQSRLAAARRSDHRQELARLHLERNMVERGDAAVIGGEAHEQIVDDEDRRLRLRSRHDAIAGRSDGHRRQLPARVIAAVITAV